MPKNPLPKEGQSVRYATVRAMEAWIVLISGAVVMAAILLPTYLSAKRHAPPSPKTVSSVEVER